MFFLILLLIILNPYVSLCMQYNDHNFFIHIPGYLMIEKVPLYYSIMEVLKDSIINGIYPVGTFLPTETKLEKNSMLVKSR